MPSTPPRRRPRASSSIRRSTGRRMLSNSLQQPVSFSLTHSATRSSVVASRSIVSSTLDFGSKSALQIPWAASPRARAAPRQEGRRDEPVEADRRAAAADPGHLAEERSARRRVLLARGHRAPHALQQEMGRVPGAGVAVPHRLRAHLETVCELCAHVNCASIVESPLHQFPFESSSSPPSSFVPIRRCGVAAPPAPPTDKNRNSKRQLPRSSTGLQRMNTLIASLASPAMPLRNKNRNASITNALTTANPNAANTRTRECLSPLEAT